METESTEGHGKIKNNFIFIPPSLVRVYRTVVQYNLGVFAATVCITSRSDDAVGG